MILNDLDLFKLLLIYHICNSGGYDIVTIMGLKREVLCLNLFSSIYLSLATAEYSEPKFKTSHYLWLETPFTLLILSLATFLNVSIINYINNQCPCSLTVHLMLYKDTFGFILVSICNTFQTFHCWTLDKSLWSIHEYLIRIP